MSTPSDKQLYQTIAQHYQSKTIDASDCILFSSLSIDQKWIFIAGLYNFQVFPTKNNSLSIDCQFPDLTPLISAFITIPHSTTGNVLTFLDINMINVLSKMCDGHSSIVSSQMYLAYTTLLGYGNSPVPDCQVTLVDKSAIFPTKKNATDNGYELTLISEVKDSNMGATKTYDTGLQVIPPLGYHIEIQPKSLLPKSGFVSGVEFINSGDNDTLKITLTKVDPSLSDIILPFSGGVQMVLKKSYHYLLN